ncbi:hypothetical protein ACFWDI_05425 [Streptomyces sp. NPDC060064]|uniref:hypothetical protein n=1 Tax=Streptomyces sp. NPDC060064 TaxID=3347049 RepID=UPI00368D3095
MTRVTVAGLSPCCAAASLPARAPFAAVSSCGPAAADGATVVTARTAAVAAPSAVRDIGRIALPI